VQRALQKEGKDPNIVDMDPEKSYAVNTIPPAKDDPEFSKFFKVCIDFHLVIIPLLRFHSHINVLLRSLLLLSGAQGKSFSFVPLAQHIFSLLKSLFRAVELQMGWETGAVGKFQKEDEDLNPIKDDPDFSKFFKVCLISL